MIYVQSDHLPVGPDARAVRHDVGDVGLLVRGVEEVGEGAARVHRHVLPAVRLGGARAGAGLLGGIAQLNSNRHIATSECLVILRT